VFKEFCTAPFLISGYCVRSEKSEGQIFKSLKIGKIKSFFHGHRCEDVRFLVETSDSGLY